MSAPLVIANCSGFYGDRLSAMREQLDGGHVDVICGDYLAELTMLILGRQKAKDASAGYARTFLQQLEDCLGEALERGIRIVSNAGGLNPAGLARRGREKLRRGWGFRSGWPPSPGTISSPLGSSSPPRAAGWW